MPFLRHFCHSFIQIMFSFKSLSECYLLKRRRRRKDRKKDINTREEMTRMNGKNHCYKKNINFPFSIHFVSLDERHACIYIRFGDQTNEYIKCVVFLLL